MRKRRMMSGFGIGLGIGMGEGAVATPLTPSQIPGVIGWWDQSRVVSGAGDVVSLPSWPVVSPNIGPTLSNATVANRPAYTAGRIVFDAANSERLPTLGVLDITSSGQLPDGASGSTAGKGFTGTGLAIASDLTFWCGNYGKPLETTAPATNFAASLVHTDVTSTVFTSEITLASIGITQNLTLAGPQGVVIDLQDGSIWFCSPETGFVYNVSVGGALVRSWAFANANGLAYDPNTNEIIVAAGGTNPTACWCAKADGAISKTRVLIIDSLDHLFMDAAGTLWGTGGINGSAGQMFKYDVVNRINTSNYLLLGCDAAEGLTVAANGLTVNVLNDAFYHGQVPALNKRLKYGVGATPTAWSQLGTKVIFGGIFKAAAVPGTTSCLMSIGEPLSPDHPGVGIFFGSTGDLRVITGGLVASDTLTITNDLLLVAVVDTVAKTVDRWINGVLQTQFSIATLPYTQYGNLPVILGACVEGADLTRFSAASVANFMLGTSTTVAWRQQIEGRLAWDAGLTSLLPIGHPYKLSPP